MPRDIKNEFPSDFVKGGVANSAYEVDSLKKREMKPFLRTKLMHSHLFHPHFKNLTDTVVNIATALEK